MLKRARNGKTTQSQEKKATEELLSEQAKIADDSDESSEYSDIEESDDESSDDELPAHHPSSIRADLRESLSAPENLAELSDSSDDEGMKNRIGNVPLEWYKDEDHIGYDITGQKIIRKPKKDAIDQLLDRRDPDKPMTVYDELNDEEIELTKEDLSIIRRLRAGTYADKNYNPFPDYVAYYTSEVRVEALGNAREPKRRFIPSKHERKRILKLVNAMRNGWIQFPSQVKEEKEEEEKVYLMWEDDGQVTDRPRGGNTIPPPKPALPGHAESYNPPAEYLPTEEETKEWKEAHPDDRDRKFLPQDHESMLEVGSYDNAVKERFERCLDLYLCARVRRKKLNIDPDSLVPKLPPLRDLRPFPTQKSTEFKGHTKRVTCLTISPSGQWLASGSEDCSVRVWEVETGRCFRNFRLGSVVSSIEWNPNPAMPLLLIGAGSRVIVTVPLAEDHTDQLREVLEGMNTKPTPPADAEGEEGENKKRLTSYWSTKSLPLTPGEEDAKWDRIEKEQEERDRKAAGLEPEEEDEEAEHNPLIDGLLVEGNVMCIDTRNTVTQVTWHAKGDYFSSCDNAGQTASVLVHRLSSQSSQTPFSKSKGAVQAVLFHTSKPVFFVATKTHIRLYNLMKQELMKKLTFGGKWISSMRMHPSGDHLLVGSYDKRVCWFDLDLSSKPFKTLRYHKRAVRSVGYHPRYPLFATGSDDGKCHVFHGKVYNDLLTNALIVPVKILDAHTPVKDVGLMSLVWHPHEPWLFTSGADKMIRMFI